jgi:hypothetical protein
VDTWRRQQGKRTRIPEKLWDAAVQVARTDGLWATASATRFSRRGRLRVISLVKKMVRVLSLKS